MRILHVRDVAHVGSTAVAGLRRLGHHAELRNLTSRGGGLILPLRLALFPERLREGLALNRYIRGQRFDVVHVHVAYMGWLGIIGGYEYFLHGHGSDLRLNLQRPVLRWFTVRSLRRARHVFYSTPDLAQPAASVRADCTFLPNPIDVDRFRPISGQESSLPRVLLLSRFEANKSPEIAMRIVRSLRRSEPKLEVDAFNWGSRVRELADPNLVRLIPTVPHDEMPALLSRYDLILGQFQIGAIGVSELEAMACGKSVAAYFIYPEAYDEPPPLIATADPDEAAARISSLLSDPILRRGMGERARAWVESHHHFLTVASILERHYRDGA